MSLRALTLIIILTLLPQTTRAQPSPTDTRITLWVVNYRPQQIHPPALVGFRFIESGLLPGDDSLAAKFTNLVAGECQASGQHFVGMAADLSSTRPTEWRIIGPVPVQCSSGQIAIFDSAALLASATTWRNRITTLSSILGPDALTNYLLAASYQQLRANDCVVATTSPSDSLLPNFPIPICFYEGKLVGSAFFLEIGEKLGLTRLKPLLSFALGDPIEVGKSIAFQLKALLQLSASEPTSWPDTFASTEFRTQNRWGGNCTVEATSPPGANTYQPGWRFVRQPEFKVYCQAPRGALFLDPNIASNTTTDWRIHVNENGSALTLQKFRIASALRLKSLAGAAIVSYMRLNSVRAELDLHLDNSQQPTFTQQNNSNATVENGEICESIEGQLDLERVYFQTRSISSGCVSLPTKLTFKAIRFEETNSRYSCDYWLDIGRPFWIRLQRIVDSRDGTTIGDRFGPQDNPNNFKVRIPDCTDSLLSQLTITASIMVGNTEVPLCTPLVKPSSN